MCAGLILFVCVCVSLSLSPSIYLYISLCSHRHSSHSSKLPLYVAGFPCQDTLGHAAMQILGRASCCAFSNFCLVWLKSSVSTLEWIAKNLEQLGAMPPETGATATVSFSASAWRIRMLWLAYIAAWFWRRNERQERHTNAYTLK